MGLACALKTVGNVALTRCMRLSLYQPWNIVLVGGHSAMVPKMRGTSRELGIAGRP